MSSNKDIIITLINITYVYPVLVSPHYLVMIHFYLTPEDLGQPVKQIKMKIYRNDKKL